MQHTRRRLLGAGAGALAAGLPGCQSIDGLPGGGGSTTRSSWPTKYGDARNTAARPGVPAPPLEERVR